MANNNKNAGFGGATPLLGSGGKSKTAKAPVTSPPSSSNAVIAEYIGPLDPRRHFESLRQLVWLDAALNEHEYLRQEFNPEGIELFEQIASEFNKVFHFHPQNEVVSKFSQLLRADPTFYANYFPEERMFHEVPGLSGLPNIQNVDWNYRGY
ncbi:uncharacterized protein LY89DRAFT_737391 [Mollisia scopiformis]|uniref:Uncharacterized protein n=1 Tax=Mollisia scopiformis TaxID=149040 RepID=A0A194WZN8_MOLSC|nr:uncharacterized protein LY89DRAFT_737391 [Mollisia scopiformis]KUJ13408.1 hypothetical protein LY89DRAFT_737391 [Mollisia scopiformis]